MTATCVCTPTCVCQDYITTGNICKHIHLMVQFQQCNRKEQLNENNSTIDGKNSDKGLNDLFQAIMSDDGDLDVIKARQHILDKIQTITTLVEQCTDKQTTHLLPNIQCIRGVRSSFGHTARSRSPPMELL